MRDVQYFDSGGHSQRSNSGWDVASTVMPGAINFNDADIKRAGLPVQGPCQTAGGMWELHPCSAPAGGWER